MIVVFYPAIDGPRIVAHCMDLDLVGQGNTVEEAFTILMRAVRVQIKACDETGANFLSPAPSDIMGLADICVL